MTEKSDIARRGEDAAAAYLQACGYDIIERNYRYGRGELDIVARDGGTTVFIEVKTRTSDRFGPPECAVTPSKQRQLLRVARGYLYDHGFGELQCRFDVLAVSLRKDAADVNHIMNAFTVLS